MSDDLLLSSLQQFVVRNTSAANVIGTGALSNSDISRGQVRSLNFFDADNRPDQCFVLIANSTLRGKNVVQVMLIGHDELLAGKNDIILHESERPMLTPSVVQTDFLFPALVADLGGVHSVLADDTLSLISQMRRKSGRDAGRVGVISDDGHAVRAAYLDEQMQVLHLASRSALGVIYTAPLSKLDVMSLGLQGNLLEQRTVESKTTDDNVRDLISYRDQKAARQALLDIQRQREEKSGMKKVSSL